MLIELLPPVAVRVIYAVLIAVNVAAFAMYGVDKKRAIADEWRIPEATLLTLAACCGPASRSSPTVSRPCWSCRSRCSTGCSYKTFL